MSFSISFWGSPPIAARFLKKLLEDGRFFVKFVVTQKDKSRTRRHRNILPTAVKEVAQKAGIEVFEPEKLALERESINRKTIEQKIDCHVVFAYGKIIPKEIFEIPPKKSVNFHASLLPKLRGPSPIESALLMDLPKTGWSLQLLGEELDTGAIIEQIEVPIYPQDDCEALSSRLEALLLEKGPDMLFNYLRDNFFLQKQNEEEATYCVKIFSHDLRLNFSEDISIIRNKARAYSCRGGLYAFFNEKRVKFKPNFYSLAYEQMLVSEEVGSLILKPKAGVVLPNGIFYLEKIQREGGKWLTPEEFAHGYGKGRPIRFN